MTKLLTFLCSPLGVMFLLLLAAMGCVVLGRRGRAALLLAAGVVWLYGWSCPLVADGLTRWWESGYPEPPLEEVPSAEAAVSLGGVICGAQAPARHPELDDAADRLWQAARLYRAGAAKRILVSGRGRGPETEAEVSVRFLSDLGVPREAILLEDRSLDTIGNARESAVELAPLGISRVLLVTSATHMPRAMRAFRHVGLDPFPVPTDFQGGQVPAGWQRWLPSAHDLRQSSVTVKEVVGSAWYALRYRAPSAPPAPPPPPDEPQTDEAPAPAEPETTAAGQPES